MEKVPTDFAVVSCPANMIVLQAVSVGTSGDSQKECSLDLGEYLLIGQPPVLALGITSFDWSGEVFNDEGK